MHRDIKLANILIHFRDVDIVELSHRKGELMENIDIVIADLGFAKELVEDLTQTQCGTPLYMAPEIQ